MNEYSLAKVQNIIPPYPHCLACNGWAWFCLCIHQSQRLRLSQDIEVWGIAAHNAQDYQDSKAAGWKVTPSMPLLLPPWGDCHRGRDKGRQHRIGRLMMWNREIVKKWNREIVVFSSIPKSWKGEKVKRRICEFVNLWIYAECSLSSVKIVKNAARCTK